RGVFLADVSDPASPKITLAERGALLSESPEKVRFHLEDGTQQELVPKSKDQYSITSFESTDIPIEVPTASERGPRDLLPVTELSLPGLLRNAQRERAAGASLLKIDPVSSSYDYLKARYYEIEFHRRFALPAACLVLALVGIPLGLSARKGGRSAGFVLTIVLVFVYYFFSLVGVSLARQGKVPPWMGVWAGNFFFLLCGLLLLWRVDRMPLDPQPDSPTQKALRRQVPAGPRRHDPARFRHVPGDDPRFVSAPRAGLHLLRIAHRHCPQPRVVHRARRIPAQPQPLADLSHGPHVGFAGGFDHLQLASEIQRVDRHESYRFQHLPCNPSGHRIVGNFCCRSFCLRPGLHTPHQQTPGGPTQPD